jgi:hypothetical protein
LSAATEVRPDWDVIIVGAGPAGLFAALVLAVEGERSVLIVDAGPDVGERDRLLRGGEGEPTHREAYVEGIGGAGLYSDGKVCLSLDVGGGLADSLSREDKQRLLGSILATFEAVLDEGPLRVPGEDQVAEAKARAEVAGLEFKYYPVLHVGTERCGAVIRRLEAALRCGGVEILPRCKLRSLRAESGRSFLEAVVEVGDAQRTLRARDVVLAMGKVGASDQRRICERLGVATSPRPLYAGARLEGPAHALQPLFDLAKDPKYSLCFADGSKIKTHCASNGGQVLLLSYEGLPLAGGHNFHDRHSGRSGFSLLWDGFTRDGDSYRESHDLMRRIGERTGGKLLVQRLNDLRRGVASSARCLEEIPLSTRECVAGDLREFFPAVYFERMEAIVERLSRLAPALPGDETVLYAPAIEWWMRRVAVEGTGFRTSCPGLYVCGDGSGWSQGIVHAAATGLLVGEGIAGAVADDGRIRSLLAETPASGRPDHALHARAGR